MISLLAGKPAPQTFPITSLSLTVRNPASTPSHPLPDIPVQVEGRALSEALQYGPTRGEPEFIGWVDGLQERFHGRAPKGEGWSSAAGSGSQDLLYKVAKTLVGGFVFNHKEADELLAGFSCATELGRRCIR